MQKVITPDKKICIAANAALMVWFFLDMIGVYFGDKYLVTRSWKDDGIYFLIFLAALLTFLFKEQIGKYILSVWLALWLALQFISHEWVTIAGGGQRQIAYFKNALKWIESETRYFPDVYHTILHILILLALVTTIIYIIDLSGKKWERDVPNN